ncbi:MAG: NAD(P)-dependent alcohol dehydrogenase [Pseudomonadota bacterium]
MKRRSFVKGSLTAAGAGVLAQLPEKAAGQSAGSDRQTYRAWEVGPKGPFNTMRLVDRPLTSPPPGHVQVEVAASGIAGRDRAITRGWFLQDKKPERIPLSEGVGTVTAVAPGVSRVAVGDRVTSIHFPRWVSGDWTPANYVADVGNTVDGWLTEVATLSQYGLVKVPESIDDATAATLSGSALTAWQALYHVAKVKSGDTVLSLGTGGVSSWGIILAKAAGARVVLTSSSDEKLAAMREKYGVDITVNYRKTPEWGQKVTELTGGKGANIVLENVGWPTLDQSLQASAVNATVVMIGTGPRPKKILSMPDFYIKNITMKAISNGSRSMMEELVRAIDSVGMKALIAKEFAFEEAVAALEFMDQSNHMGKVVIRHA